MLTLVIDTATAACSVALIDGDGVRAERHELVGRGHAERVAPMIAELLGRQRPDAILVDVGPGSFTGIRVGLAAAHGLAIGWRVPLAGYSSTALIAAGCDHPIAVALIGGHGELFVQSWAHDPLHPLDELRSLAPPAAAAVIGAEHVRGTGAEALVSARGWGTAEDAAPRAADAVRLPAALRSLPARPLYGRAPDAKPNR